jgi:THO complex subunit 3
MQTNQVTFNHTTPPTHLLLTCGDGSISILSYPSLSHLHTLHAHTSSCVSLALSPTARYLAIGGTDALISLYDTTEWVCKRTLTGMVGTVKSVGFSFDGSFVVGGSDEGGTLEVCHVESGESVGKVDTGGGAGVVAWHPGRYWIAWAGEGGGLKILGAAGGQL